MTLPSEDLAYIAGLFDGEGTTRINKTRHRGKYGGKNIYYYLDCMITNTDLPILKYLRDCFGGSIHAHSNNGKGTKPCWVWKISSNIALKFLYQIVRFLKIKRREVEASIIFQEFKHQLNGRGKMHSPKNINIMDEAYNIIRLAKKEVRQ